jgi:hypothetical protein
MTNPDRETIVRDRCAQSEVQPVDNFKIPVGMSSKATIR